MVFDSNMCVKFLTRGVARIVFGKRLMRKIFINLVKKTEDLFCFSGQFLFASVSKKLEDHFCLSTVVFANVSLLFSIV